MQLMSADGDGMGGNQWEATLAPQRWSFELIIIYIELLQAEKIFFNKIDL